MMKTNSALSADRPAVQIVQAVPAAGLQRDSQEHRNWGKMTFHLEKLNRRNYRT